MLLASSRVPAGARGRRARGAGRSRCRRPTPRSCWPPRSRSTRSGLELSADLIDLVDPQPAATCSTGSRRCAARSPSTSASWCRRCAPATTSSCRCGPTRSCCSASRSRAARRRPAPCSRSATSSARCRASRPRSRSSASRRSGSPPSCAARPSSAAPPSSTAPRSSPPTSPRSSPSTPPACSAARTSGCSPTSSSAPTRSSSRSSPRPSSASARCSGSCRRCSTRASRSATWSGSSRRCRCAPPRTKELDALVEAARAALGPAHRRAVPGRQDPARPHPRPAARAADPGVAAPVRARARSIALDPETGQALLTQLAQLAADVENRNLRPVLVCAPQMRAAVRRLVQPVVPRLAVLSYQELTGADQIRSEGVVTAESARRRSAGMSPVCSGRCWSAPPCCSGLAGAVGGRGRPARCRPDVALAAARALPAGRRWAALSPRCASPGRAVPRPPARCRRHPTRLSRHATTRARRRVIAQVPGTARTTGSVHAGRRWSEQ